MTVRSLAVGMTVLAAWLLFNFDAWHPLFRRRAVAALFGAHALRGALFPFLVIPGFVLTSDATALRTMAAIPHRVACGVLGRLPRPHPAARRRGALSLQARQWMEDAPGQSLGGRWGSDDLLLYGGDRPGGSLVRCRPA